MPDFKASAYANHPINIPPEFPRILKQYTKAAIRTQPKDLLLWSVAYFRCLSNGEIPPVKERLEYPIPPSESGLTPGLLRILHKQLGRETSVQKSVLQGKWRGICLAMHHLEEILHQGSQTDDNVHWRTFLLEAAASIVQLQPPTVIATMEIICEAMADHPDGSSSRLGQTDFVEMLKMVCQREAVDTEVLDEIEEVLKETALRQEGMLSANNLEGTGVE